MARPARAFRNPPAPVGAGDRVNLGVAVLSQGLRRVVHIKQPTPTRVRGGCDTIRWLFLFFACAKTGRSSGHVCRSGHESCHLLWVRAGHLSRPWRTTLRVTLLLITGRDLDESNCEAQCGHSGHSCALDPFQNSNYALDFDSIISISGRFSSFPNLSSTRPYLHARR